MNGSRVPLGLLLAGVSVIALGCGDDGGDVDSTSGSTSTTQTPSTSTSTTDPSGSTSVDPSSTTDPSTSTSESTTGSTGATDGSSGSSTGGSSEVCTSFDEIASIGIEDSSGNGFSIDLDGDVAFVNVRTGGLLSAIDISDPSDPTELDTLDIGDSLGASSNGTYVAVGLNAAGVATVEFSDNQLFLASSIPGSGFGVVWAGDVIYAGDRGSMDGGLAVINATNPDMIVNVMNTGPTSGAQLTVDGDRLYLSHQSAMGLSIWDISDATNPAQLAHDATIAAEWEVIVEGTLAYAVDRGIGVTIVETNNLPTMTEVGSIPGALRGLDVQGDVAFTGGQDGVTVYDVSDPSTPTEIGSYTDATGINDIVVRGNLAFIATESAELEVLELCPSR